jgi:hypothetical protein
MEPLERLWWWFLLAGVLVFAIGLLSIFVGGPTGVALADTTAELGVVLVFISVGFGCLSAGLWLRSFGNWREAIVYVFYGIGWIVLLASVSTALRS